MEEPKTVQDFYAVRIKNMFAYFFTQHFSFWMICGYLFFEFVKPQALYPQIDFLPWAQLLLMGAMIGAFVDPTVKWVSSAANIYITLFFITILISIATALYPEISHKNFMLFFGWFVIYFLVINIVNTPERFYLFIFLYLVAAGKIALGTSLMWASRGFSFAGWGLMGPSGYFQNSGELAILMVMLFPLAFYLYQYFKEKVKLWERILLLLFWVCPILTVLGASSRGSQVALLCVMAIMFRKSVFRLKPLIGVVVLVMAFIWLLPDEQKERFSDAGEDKTSQQRLLYWENGWEMMKDYPFAGVGYFNFIPYFNDYYPEDVLFEDRGAELPHNIFIQVGTDAGFIALSFFILLILYCLYTPIKIRSTPSVSERDRYLAAGLGYGVFGFVIAGQFVTVSYYPFLWVHLAFIVAHRNICVFQKEKK